MFPAGLFAGKVVGLFAPNGQHVCQLFVPGGHWAYRRKLGPLGPGGVGVRRPRPASRGLAQAVVMTSPRHRDPYRSDFLKQAGFEKPNGPRRYGLGPLVGG